MVVDSSALLSILLNEPESSAFARALDCEGGAVLSAASYLEVCIVLSSRHQDMGLRLFEALLAKAHIEIEAVSVEQAFLARRAFQKYGRGRHKAALNFGDCFAYALAKDRDEPLLYKGTDFSLTDIQKAA